jgi:hypothetical protein
MAEKFNGLYEGVVTFRDDPLLLSRIKVRIPGILTPESADHGPWAWPRGAGGSKQFGKNSVPPLDADVLIQFVNGDINYPVWETAWHGIPIIDGQPRSEAFPEHEHPDIHVFGIGGFRLVIDDRQGQRSATFKVVKMVAGKEEAVAWLEFNYETNSAQLWADSAVQVAGGALVDVDGSAVQVRGRKVMPSSKPIN